MPTIVHFDIAAEIPGRAKTFYESLFGWKMMAPPGMPEEYYLFETKNLDGSAGPGGGVGKRGEPSQRITAYIGVDSVDMYREKVKKLGGKVVQPKLPVAGWGYLTVCQDTEGNSFGLWQDDPKAH